MKANFTEEELTLLKSIINKLTEEDVTVKPDYSKVKVGDYMLKDGTTVSPDEITKEQKGQAIGIVAYLYNGCQDITYGVESALKDKGIEKPHGLVIALNDVGNGKGKYYEWSKVNFSITGYRDFNGQVFSVLDGLDKTNSLKNIDDFPAFKAAKNYEKEVQAPKNTTGWYLPSIGEWFRMLNNYKEFSKYISQGMGCWSSSGFCTDFAYYVGFYNDGGFYYYIYRRNYTNYVRPILAF